MTGNDLDNNSKAKQKETSEKEDLSKYFIKQPKEMNAEELIVNNGQPEKEDANDEPIYAISDFEGRYDYYIRFLIDIGFFNKEKLKEIVRKNIEEKYKDEKDKDKDKKNKYLSMLNDFLNGDLNQWIVEIDDDKRTDALLEILPKELAEDINKQYKKGTLKRREKTIEAILKQNKERMSFLLECFGMDVINKPEVFNEDFKGKIVVNGDLYSSRVTEKLFSQSKCDSEEKEKQKAIKTTKDINRACLNLFKAINEHNKEKDSLILIAGNHDVFHLDYLFNRSADRQDDDILKDIKEKTLPYLKNWHIVSCKDGRKIIFKHSPYLTTDIIEKILKNKKNVNDKEDCIFSEKINDRRLLKYTDIMTDENEKEKYDFYFYDSFNDGQYPFNDDFERNNSVSKILQQKNIILFTGHCHAGGQKIGDHLYNIDHDGAYKFYVMHQSVGKNISNNANQADKNQNRIDICYDDLKEHFVERRGHNMRIVFPAQQLISVLDRFNRLLQNNAAMNNVRNDNNNPVENNDNLKKNGFKNYEKPHSLNLSEPPYLRPEKKDNNSVKNSINAQTNKNKPLIKKLDDENNNSDKREISPNLLLKTGSNINDITFSPEKSLGYTSVHPQTSDNEKNNQDAKEKTIKCECARQCLGTIFPCWCKQS